MSNLKQLEVFAAVVECGGFTEAANQFYMAQSTVGSHSGGWRGCRMYRCSTAPSCQFPDMRRRFPGSTPIAAEICHLGKSPQLFAGAGQADSPREGRLPVKRKPFGRFCSNLIGGCVSPYSFKGDIWRICALHLRGCTSIIKSQKQKLKYCPRVKDFCRRIGGYACAYSSAAGGG